MKVISASAPIITQRKGSTSRTRSLVELYPPDGATDHSCYDTFSVEWAKKWPSEEIWVTEKRR